ncbi:MFS transporter [Paenibacillus sp. PK3_47]|uniref:MFS transporter n=1 Tax=Paenibacillus sp. PK3_47 TaxID=2072642 RepID=UPI00201E4885|nr:MFS transporter [Paenibacillus sp. PK3_47]UQZ35489.1 MFS transporter [Paenibacillus sp. PK3_47]
MNASVLKNKNFLFLILAKLISSIGTFVQSTAFALYVIDQTHSSLLFASVLMATLIPRGLLSPVCGVIIDWMNRKRLLITLDIISGAILVAVVVILNGGDIGLPLIYCIAVLLGIVSAFDEPIVMTVIPSIVDKEGLESANALNMVTLSLGNILGPILGVLLYGMFGIHVILLVNGASFLLAALLQSFMNIPVENTSDEKRSFGKFRSDFVEGLRYLWGNSRMKTIIICIIIQNCFFNGATQVGIPFVAREQLKVSNAQFSLIEICVIVGVVLGIAFSGVIKKNKTTDQLFVRMLSYIGVAFLCIGLVVFGWISSSQINFYLILCFYLILGITSINVSVSFQAELQREVDNKLLGRISSVVLALIMASVPVGQGLYGWMFETFPSEVPFLISAFVILLIAASYRTRVKKGTTIQRGTIHETSL